LKNKNVNIKNKALNPTVAKLGMVSFFADVASEMLYPITPIFLTTILGASATFVGVIEGIAEAVASLLKTYSGIWSDRILRRRPFLFAGYFLGAISKPLIGLSSTWIGVLSARVIDRTGKGLRSSPRDALIADSVDASARGAAFGWHRGMDTLGAAVGPLLALLLLSFYGDNLRPLYYWAAIPGLFSVLVIFFVKEPASGRTKSEASKWKNPLSLWGEFGGEFKNYIFAWGIFSLTNSSDVFLLLRARQMGFSTAGVIWLYCAYNLVYSLSSPYLGKLSDSIGRKKLMLFGMIMFAGVYVGFAFAGQLWHFAFLFAAYGLYMGATDGVGKAMAVDYAPSRLKASAVGILGTVTGFCTILASTMAGLLWDHAGEMWPFLYGAAGALVAAVYLKVLKKI